MAVRLKRLKRGLLRISGLSILAVFWELTARMGVFNGEIFAGFTDSLKALVDMAMHGSLYMHFMSTLWRFTVGILLSSLLAIPLGVVLAEHYKIYLLFEPLIRIFAKINPFSLLPLLIVFLGTGEIVRLAAILWVGFFPILFSTVNGVLQTDTDLVRTARALNISRPARLWKVSLPAAGHSIFTGIRIGVEMTFFMIVAGEMLGANSGLGYLMHSGAHHYFDAPKVYACGLVIAGMGVCIHHFFRFLQSGLFFWQESVSLFGGRKSLNRVKRIDGFTLFLTGVFLSGILIAGAGQIERAAYVAENPVVFLSEQGGAT